MIRYPHILAVIVALAAISTHTRADIVTLKDGTTHEGTVIKETRAEVVLEIVIANIKSTKSFPRYKVRSIEYKPVETAEESRDEAEETPSKSTIPEVEEQAVEEDADDDQNQRVDRAAALRDRVLYMVIPVEGTIGVETNATGLRNALTQARRKKAAHIIFTINSGGGYVYDAVACLEVLKEFDNDFEYHALIEEGAISAASIYVAAADSIWARPGSRVGGAVAYSTDNTSGAAEVDAKFNSIWAAEIASRAQSKGHPPEIFRAMVEPGAEVWFDEEGKVYPSRPSTRGAQQIDNATTILTIRADQMIQIGMAKEFTGALSELGEMLDIGNWAEMRAVGERAMLASGKERVELQDKFDDAIKVFRDALKDYEKDNPRSFNDYRVYTQRDGSRIPDGPSLQRWRERSILAIRHCDVMLAALARVAEVNKRAEKIGALHLNIVPDDLGHEAYTQIRDERDWLIRNRDNVAL